MRVVNSTIQEFIGFVLNENLEVPVVDQTGLGAEAIRLHSQVDSPTLSSQPPPAPTATRRPTFSPRCSSNSD